MSDRVSSRTGGDVSVARAGALAVGLVAAAAAATAFWLYGLLLLVATGVAVWIVGRRPRGLRSVEAHLGGSRAARFASGAAAAAVAVALITALIIAPLYVVRLEQGHKTRAKNWVRDANHELDSRDFDTARLYLQRAEAEDPDVPGLQKTRDRLRALSGG